MVHYLDAQVSELLRVGGAQHQVTNHGVAWVTNPARLDDDADNSRSSAVMGEIADAFTRHGQMIGLGDDADRPKGRSRNMTIKVGIDQGVDLKALRRLQRRPAHRASSGVARPSLSPLDFAPIARLDRWSGGFSNLVSPRIDLTQDLR